MEDEILTTILCISKGKDGYTIADFEEDWKKGDKESLADFIYKRFNERYILPFKNNPKKHGFSMMAVACLMIEALESFRQGLGDSTGKSRKCFKCFFLNCDELKDFRGLEDDFYEDIRCAILHQAETSSGWKISRAKDVALLDEQTKTINATKFLDQLEEYLTNYKEKLETHDFKDDIWVKFKKKKMDVIIENCHP